MADRPDVYDIERALAAGEISPQEANYFRQWAETGIDPGNVGKFPKEYTRAAGPPPTTAVQPTMVVPIEEVEEQQRQLEFERKQNQRAEVLKPPPPNAPIEQIEAYQRQVEFATPVKTRTIRRDGENVQQVIIKTQTGQKVIDAPKDALTIINASNLEQTPQLKSQFVILPGMRAIPKNQWEYLKDNDAELAKALKVSETRYNNLIQKREDEFNRTYLKTDAGEYVNREHYNQLKKDDPRLADVLNKKGVDAFNRDVGSIILEQELESQEINPGGTKAIKKEQRRETAKEVGYSLIPVYGTIRYAKQLKSDGELSGKDKAKIAGSAILDIITLVPVVGGIAAGARAAKGITTGARIAGALKGAGRVALAEVKAPYTVIRYPIKTLKTAAEPFETIFAAKKIPLGSAEISTSTIRLPKSEFISAEDAMKLRDLATGNAIRGETATVKLAGQSVKLTPTALNKIAAPIAVHGTSDIRPFLEGIVITGKEGGLYVAPSLYTRFSQASAFGNAPKDGIKGALLFRDEAIIGKLAGSNKIYKNTVEIEKLLPNGYRLKPPNQMIWTRDASGNKLAMLVFGKPFTPTEIARLKFVGSVDTVKNIFSPTAKIGRYADEYDELNDIRKEAQTLYDESTKLKKAGNTSEATRLRNRADALVERSNRIAERLSQRMGANNAVRLAFTNTTRRSPISDWDRVNRTGAAKKNIRVAPELNLNRFTTAEQARLAQIGTAKEQTRTIAPSDTRKVITLDSYRAEIDKERRITPTTSERVTPFKTERVNVDDIERRIPPEIPDTVTPPPPPPPKGEYSKITRPRSGASEKEKRGYIEQSDGAIAWRQGKVWAVMVSPYESEDDLIVLSEKRRPVGAQVFEGKGSAFKSIQLLRGKKTPKDDTTIDWGSVDYKIDVEGKKLNLTARADPKLQTVSDFSVTKRPRSVSKRGKISISPKRPRRLSR